MNRRQWLLYIIIAIEGYVVLATELLAIRQLIPFVGSGTEVVSIIISAVLLPLAIGYHYGGRRAESELKKAHKSRSKAPSIRAMLLRNLITSLIILTFGLSYYVLEMFFLLLNTVGIHHRILQTALYSITFLVMPTFLLAQTVPLVSNYFSQMRLSEITGRMLFFSTTGSFLGSIISTLLLMTLIGVHNTVNVTVSLIALLILLLSRKWFAFDNVLALLFAGIVWTINGDAAMQQLNIVANTPYSMMRISEARDRDMKILHINRSMSSGYAPKKEDRFEYLQYIEKHFIEPKSLAPKNILVLGAGGFTVGWDDRFNKYVFVDIDPELKPVSEKYLLPSPLPENKKFIATSARAFLKTASEKYDFVFVDVYSNVVSIPMEAVTREFLLDAKNVVKPGGIVLVNVIASPTLNDKFSVRYNNTFASVFPTFTRQIIGDYDGWAQGGRISNLLYIYYHNAYADDKTLYTDNKNTYSFDR